MARPGREGQQTSRTTQLDSQELCMQHRAMSNPDSLWSCAIPVCRAISLGSQISARYCRMAPTGHKVGQVVPFTSELSSTLPSTRDTSLIPNSLVSSSILALSFTSLVLSHCPDQRRLILLYEKPRINWRTFPEPCSVSRGARSRDLYMRSRSNKCSPSGGTPSRISSQKSNGREARKFELNRPWEELQ